MDQSLIDRLLASDEPAVRYKMMVNVLGAAPDAPEVRQARQAVKKSPRTAQMLAGRGADGRFPLHPYQKWNGSHWVLSLLADLGYPSCDTSLFPLLDQVFEWLFSSDHLNKVMRLDGRYRRCASQEGNALYAVLALGIADERFDELVANLLKWQWPDGGWNCDKCVTADTSSFMESLIPFRGLALYAQVRQDAAARAAAVHAAEVFLDRVLFRSRSAGAIIRPEFVKLFYPYYWHYNILFALKVMTEAGLICDPRCAPALDLLESKRLPDGGFPAEMRYYRVMPPGVKGSNVSSVDWGGVSTRNMNEWVTVDALAVLHAAGRD